VFDGSGDYLDVSQSIEFDFGERNCTIEHWASFPSTPTTNNTYGLISNLTSSGSGVGGSGWQTDLENVGGTLKLRFQFWDSGGTNRTGHQNWTPSLNTWYHIAVVRNGDVFTTYIDGTSIGSTTLAFAMKNFAHSSGLFIGATRSNSYGSQQLFIGEIDEVRLSRTARYTSNFTPSTTAFNDDKDTVLLMHMDGGGGIDPTTNLATQAGEGVYFWDASSACVARFVVGSIPPPPSMCIRNTVSLSSLKAVVDGVKLDPLYLAILEMRASSM
jgi:hypothetical protein